MGELSGKIAVVTGAARGIGEAIAKRFDDAGAKLILLDKNGPGIKDTAANLRDAIGVEVDVSNVEDVTKALAGVDIIDVVVNNAGWDLVEPFLANDPMQWDHLWQVNLRSTIAMTYVTLPKMRKGGRIVNIASDAARRFGTRDEAVYSACKAGVIQFSKAIAADWRTHEVSVNVISPGCTATPLMKETIAEPGAAAFIDYLMEQTPMDRMADPSEIAAGVFFFATGPAYITGQVMSVSGGLTMAS